MFSCIGINLFIRGGETEPSSYGLVLLFLSLVLDGVTSACQEQLQIENILTTHELMFFVNLWAVVLTFILAIISGEGNSGVQFCQENPKVIPYIQVAAIASTLGQNFIFFTISNLDSLTLAAITTSRKLITIVLSVFIFGHKIAYIQWTGVALLFSGLFYEWISHGDEHSSERRVNWRSETWGTASLCL
jgi:UDP-galactose transporter B1